MPRIMRSHSTGSSNSSPLHTGLDEEDTSRFPAYQPSQPGGQALALSMARAADAQLAGSVRPRAGAV
jgi:hypothetical protein